MRTGALSRQRFEPFIERGSHVQNRVVVADQAGRLFALLWAVECSGRKLVDIHLAPGDSPVDLLDRRVIGDPGFCPVIESHGHELALLIGVPWSKRPQAMKHVPVTDRPRDQRNYGDYANY